MNNAIAAESIPAALANAPQWVLWRYEERDGKPTKPPYQSDGRHASHTDPSTWGELPRILKRYQRGGWDGIGFVLSDYDPLGGIDLDHCIAETGEIEPWAQAIIERIDSYTEISPSGKGVRIFLKGELPIEFPRGGRKLTGLGEDGHGAIEVYCRLRYLTYTGRHIAGTPVDIEPRAEVFTALCLELFPPKSPAQTLSSTNTPTPLSLSDAELLAKMFASHSGLSLIRLWNGDTSAYDGDESRADCALLAHLAFWTQKDEAWMDRLFRQSQLYREKWEREDYREWTLAKACEGVTEVYESSQAFDPEASGTALDPEQQDELAQAQAAVETLAETLKADTGYPFTAEGKRVLGLLRALDAASWARVKTCLQRARISVRDVEAALPKPSEFLPDPATAATERGSTRAGDTLTGCPAPATIIPHPYYVEPGVTGKWRADESSNSTKKEPFIFAPVLISGRTVDINTGAEALVLAWQWKGSPWQMRLVDRDTVAQKRQLLALAKYGMPIADHNGQEFIAYLNCVEAANRETLPCARVSGRLGWQGAPETSPFLCGRKLVLPDGAIEDVDAIDVSRPNQWSANRICFKGDEGGQDQVVDAYHTRGTLDGWKDAVKVCAAHPRMLVMLYASFAAPLLDIFNVRNFGVDASTDTTRGKTTALRTAASVWGAPDEQSACSTVLTWDATRVGLERTSEIMSFLPLCVDDTKKAKSPKAVAELIYAVSSGRGRVRGTVGGLAHTPTWRTIMLSTGEQPATSFTQDGGTRTRIISMIGPPMGAQTPALGRVASALNAGIFQHYGHAGPRFLSWLQLNKPSWGEWVARHAALSVALADSAPSPEAGRLAPYAALITIAGEMAHRALGLPWEFNDPISTLWQDLAAEAADAAGSERALDDIYSWASSRETSFIGRHVTDGFVERTPPVTLGRWDPGTDWEYIAVWPSVLAAALTELGYSPPAILRGWRERGLIRCHPKSFTWDVRIPSGETKKMTYIYRHAFERGSQPPLSELGDTQ